MLNPLEKLPQYVSAIAAIIVLLACIAIGAPLYWMAAWVSLTIVLFYVIGQVLKYLLVSSLYPPEEVEEAADIEYEEEPDLDDLIEDEDENAAVEDAFLDN